MDEIKLIELLRHRRSWEQPRKTPSRSVLIGIGCGLLVGVPLLFVFGKIVGLW